jgi:hypothetical protein
MELSEAFDSVLESPQYQKTRLMLDCINQEILERDESGDDADKDYDGDGEVESGKDEYMGSRDKAIKKAKAEKQDESYIVNTDNPAEYVQNIRYCQIVLPLNTDDLNYLGQYQLNIYGDTNTLVFISMVELQGTQETNPFISYESPNEVNENYIYIQD